MEPLRAGDDWKLVDPDGLLAEPEADLGVLMREDPVELLTGDPGDRARWLAARTGTDPVAIVEWGVLAAGQRAAQPGDGSARARPGLAGGGGPDR